jgi:GNAT superfamily N-acetyltransferase
VTIEIAEEPPTALAEYARIPIAFTVDRVLDVAVHAEAPDRFIFSERELDRPYVKDYDAIDGEGPLNWPRRFDLSSWTLFVARLAGHRVGGAAVTLGSPGLTPIEGQRDLAVLWDLRVAPDARRQGIGAALFNRVAAWARSQGCTQLTIETQNVNVAACRFYARQACELRGIRRGAYPALREEIQLVWCKDLRTAR